MMKIGKHSAFLVFTMFLAGCHTTPDSWRPVPAEAGKAWHNESCQQTAFDRNEDGRIDRLRFWMGSGTARELHDNDFDGWFDDLVLIVHERESERRHQRVEAPLVPVTGSSGAFDRPR